MVSSHDERRIENNEIRQDALEGIWLEQTREYLILDDLGRSAGRPVSPSARIRSVRFGIQSDGLVYSDGLFTVSNGRALGERFVRDHNGVLPDAVIVAADVIAVGMLQAFNAVGVLVPRDISVISINNQTISQLTSPPLSTFSIDLNELARVATLTLGDAISGKRTIRQHVYLSTSLVARDSFVPAK